MTYLTDENRAAQKELLGELTDRALCVLLGGELDDSVGCSIGTDSQTRQETGTHPHPLETPVGVTRTSAKRTSPANQTQKKSSH